MVVVVIVKHSLSMAWNTSQTNKSINTEAVRWRVFGACLSIDLRHEFLDYDFLNSFVLSILRPSSLWIHHVFHQFSYTSSDPWESLLRVYQKLVKKSNSSIHQSIRYTVIGCVENTRLRICITVGCVRQYPVTRQRNTIVPQVKIYHAPDGPCFPQISQ